jgi:predicted DNA binding CopG/RHH family protein
MENDFLQEFINQATQENEDKIAQEKRKKHFQELGRKGGLKTKENKKLDKVISIRMSHSEYENLLQKQEKYPLKLSTYIRNVLFEKELKINEFKTDEILLQFGNNFKKITNLLRNREWTVFENKKEILAKIETTVDLIHHYLYSKIQKNDCHDGRQRCFDSRQALFQQRRNRRNPRGKYGYGKSGNHVVWIMAIGRYDKRD